MPLKTLRPTGPRAVGERVKVPITERFLDHCTKQERMVSYTLHVRKFIDQMFFFLPKVALIERFLDH
jgi:hypothetical protein